MMSTSVRATGDVSTKAYAQWVTITIHNSSNKTIVIKNVHLPWGKFHRDNDKDAELRISEIEGIKIGPGGKYKINSCGRENASSGTEGEFEIFEDGGPKIRHFYWNCPWRSNMNIWTISGRNNNWVVESHGFDLDSVALGSITVGLFNEESKGL